MMHLILQRDHRGLINLYQSLFWMIKRKDQPHHCCKNGCEQEIDLEISFPRNTKLIPKRQHGKEYNKVKDVQNSGRNAILERDRNSVIE